MSTLHIGTRAIGRDAPPFVIAEMSGNHNQSLDRALALVEAAAKAGAHALKLQTYTPDTMTLDLDEGEFHIGDPDSPWTGTSLYRLYGEAHTPWEWHEPIFRRAAELGMLAFSTPFDATAVDFLESLDVPAYKIASFENVDLPLIRRVAATGKPLIVSTGMASLAEIQECVEAARGAGCEQLILLKCTSTYPASPSNTNLRSIPHMRELFGCEIGLSDHTLGVGASVAAVALGASVIEKHFTLSRADGGVDSTFSLEPDELAALVAETERAWQALGGVSYGPTAAERKSLVFRRSLYVVRDMAAGEAFSEANVRAIRPGLGLPPKYLEQVLGSVASEPLKRGQPLALRHLRDAPR
ncbi:pseudaminic acid synthase [Pseudomonas solani]|uniref:Pseudaminic acid synthase n=1 Tax=Pseudomonas solani TaxID=2731552 RepID=A0AAU7Y9L2_9PSED